MNIFGFKTRFCFLLKALKYLTIWDHILLASIYLKILILYPRSIFFLSANFWLISKFGECAYDWYPWFWKWQCLNWVSWWLSGKRIYHNAGNVGWIPGSGRSSGEENDNPLQDSCLVIPWIVFKLGSASINNGTYWMQIQIILHSWWGCVCTKSLQSCLTLCDPMDYSQPGSSVHAILQARILEWVAMSFSRRSFRPRDPTLLSHVSCVDR